MPTLADSAYRARLLDRLATLRPEAKARFGRLDAHGMLCHLADALEVALRERPTVDRSGWLERTVVKWAVINLPIPIPKGKIQTAPEMLATQPSTWSADLDRVVGLVGRLAVADEGSIHPLFGPMTAEQWRRLQAKHIEHHLDQFGV